MKELKSFSNPKPIKIEFVSKCDRDVIWSDDFNCDNVFGGRREKQLLDNPMLDFRPKDAVSETISSQMLEFEPHHDKEYYQDQFPLFSQEICTMMEWYDHGKWSEFKTLLKVRRREEKLRKRREFNQKMKELGIKYNHKKGKMKKIRKDVVLNF